MNAGGLERRGSRRHLLGIEELTRRDIVEILDAAKGMKQIFGRPVKKFPALRGRVMANLFYEPSTRTRTSFELAGKWLSADVLNISISTSSVVKGESLTDTSRTLEALGADFVVIRHAASGVPHRLALVSGASVINAGDGAHEHPTQALLDLFTMRERFGGIEGLRVAIVGDVLHSRVARSNVWGLTKLGAQVVLVGPATLVPREMERIGPEPGTVRVSHNLDAVLRDVDVVNMLRMQRERQSSASLPNVREYVKRFGLDRRRLDMLRPDAVVMHPGPANLGVEITEDVAEDPRSLIADQVTNGVAVRMAVLYLLAGEGEGVNRS